MTHPHLSRKIRSQVKVRAASFFETHGIMLLYALPLPVLFLMYKPLAALFSSFERFVF